MERKSLWGKQLVKCSTDTCTDRIKCERYTTKDSPNQCYAVFKGITKTSCQHYIPNIDAMRGKL